MPEICSSAFEESLLTFIEEISASIAAQRLNESFSIFSKDDGSPVTSADILASEAWCSFLADHFPDDGIVSEENTGFKTGRSGRTWFVDPIDGTKQFIDGSSDYYMLAGLEFRGEAIFGIHANPLSGQVIVAEKNYGVFQFQTGEPGLKVQLQQEEASSSYFHLKGVEPDVRRDFFHQYGFKKPAFPSSHVHMLSPLTLGYQGFATFRETWYWDLLAPAAIMSVAGFQVYPTSLNGSAGFSDSSMRCSSLICLPSQAPQTLVQALKSMSQNKFSPTWP